MAERSHRLYAISDLHLPGAYDKSMDLFGSHWQNHFGKISKDWKQRVQPDDIVLVSGDISWAMHLAQAQNDLDAIGALPGRKVMIKGNHDYWWSAIGRVRSRVHSSIYVLQNDAIQLDDYVFCGSRGWIAPSGEEESVHNQRIYTRELERLKLSLEAGKSLGCAKRLVVLCHFPPFGSGGESSAVTQLIEEYQVDDVVYGHLHGQACITGFTGIRNGVRYWLTSCDCVDFRLVDLDLFDM